VDTLSQAIEKGQTGEPIDTCFLPHVNPVNNEDNMQDILAEVAEKPWPVPVVNSEGRYLGVVSKNRFLKTLHKSDQNGNGNAADTEA
jgi:glycine betaine/proline transport system ATP-binding protein